MCYQKILLIIAFFLLISFDINAGIKPGFDKYEAVDMARLINSFTFLDLYNTDTAIIPDSYEKYYTSGVFGMDNRFQIYLKKDVAVINFRGSTDKQLSWLENIHSAMIPATGTIIIQGEKFDYCFAKDTSASVHSGYALGIAYFYSEIIFHLNNLNRLGYKDFILTGHSQGGSIANLMLAYLNNLQDGIVSANNTYKTYAFAAPMVGNRAFQNEYNSRFCTTEQSFNVVNPEDRIPKLPLSSESYLSDTSMSLAKKLLIDAAFSIFDKSITNRIHKLSYSTNKQIQNELGEVSLPPFTDDINYLPLGNNIEIPPFNYPLILKDSSILQNDSLMAIYSRDENGVFNDKSVYKSPPFGFNHKPYNYYVSMLKKYFPEQYAALEKKVLPQNL